MGVTKSEILIEGGGAVIVILAASLKGLCAWYDMQRVTISVLYLLSAKAM